MARPIVKYLDPVSGEYEFATVLDIGDLNKLNTSVKTDIVSAINSILSGGVGGGSPIDDHRISQIEQVIKSLQDGTFDIVNFDSIDNYLRQEFLDGINNINEQNKLEMEAVLTQLDIHVNDVIQDYQERVAAQNVLLDNAQNTLVDARETLEDKAAELELANIGFSELEYDFNELDRYITANVRTIDFDNFNAMTEDYESVVAQTSNEVGVDMRGSTLSYLTGRVTDAEASISAQADEITSKMSYDEFQYMPIPKYDYGENLLFNTFDFHDMWIARNGAQVTQDTFLFGKIIAFNSPTGAYDTISDDLIVGESYVFTAYVNVQPSSKEPTESRFEPVSGSYDPEDFQLQIGTKVFNPKVYESLLGINGWVRIQQEFVADAVNPAISINPVGVDGRNELAYMSMPKLEQGLTVTPWQPHLNDEYATLSSTQSMIKQQANSIVAFVTEVQQLDDSYKQATSTFQMLADGFKANTEAIEAYEEAVARYGTEYSNINGKFEQRVWRDDFQAVIEDINIDNRNRVLNSDFIRNHLDPSNRRLIVEDWSINEDWYIESTENNEYLCRKRTGLTNALATTATSNYFPVRNGERVLFSFELIHSGLDDDKVFAIELFDITDRRLLKQEFSLESMNQVGNRYHGSFSLQSPGAEKGRVVLQLPKNGEVKFTRVSFQNADIGSVDWSPAPEDSWIIQSRLATYISQVEDEVTIGGVGRKLDTLTGLLSEDKGTFTLNPDKIATEVVNSKTYDDMGVVDRTNFEQTASGWMNEITSDGRLAGYVNATPDTYKISFDKIHLEGTTWADALGSSRITVTDRFSLVGQNGRPVLDVKSDGSVAMNVTSLNIGSYSALTEGDKDSLEEEVTQNVINTTQPYIHIAYADTIEGEGLLFNPSGKGFIGFAKSHLPTPSETASNYVWSKYVGKDGYTPIKGEDYFDGDDGVSVTGITEYYLASELSSGVKATSEFEWSTSIPETNESKPFLWNYETTQLSNGTSTAPTEPVIIGRHSVDGVSITGVTNHYALGESNVIPPTSGWSETPKPTDENNRYLWNYETITYSKGQPTDTKKVVIGTHGAKGAKGDPGPRGIPGDKGDDGQSQWVHIRYSANSNGSGMEPNPSSTTKYVGIAVTNSDKAPGHTGFTWSKYVGDKGDPGQPGLPGDKGDDGTTTYTWVRYADTPTSGMDQFPAGKKYIGLAFNQTDEDESNNYGDYQWSLMPQNIEIGGRNLLKGTSDSFKEINPRTRFTSLPENSITPISEYGLKVGDTITFRIYIQAHNSVPANARITYHTVGGGYSVATGNRIQASEEGYSTVTYTIPSNVDRLEVGLDAPVPAGSTSILMYYKEAKFEKGNTATGWTPAPEDVETAYTAVAQAKAEAERVKAEAYADGKVTAEEKARIADANAKLAAAKKYAVDQILADKTIKDTRNDNQTPAWYYTNHPRRTIKEFKFTSTIGVVSSEGTYGILETEIPWTDAFGGPVKQTFRVNSKTFKRSGTTTSWSSWISYDDIAETAKSDAATAKSIADGAATSASNANSLLSDIASDSKLTPTEKKAAKKEWDIIVGEKPKIDSSADTYGIITEKTAYNTAYNTLKNYLSGLLANLNDTDNIVGTTFRANFKAYYNARQDLLNKIADSAKSLIDDIEVGGRNLLTGTSEEEQEVKTSSWSIGSWNPSLIIGEEYTFSFDIKSENATYLQNVFLNSSNSGFIPNTPISKEWTRVSFTFKWKGGTYNGTELVPHIYPRPDYSGTYVSRVKLEKGNKATDWTPAPEDVQESIDETNALATSARDIATTAEQMAAEGNTKIDELSATDFILREGYYQDLIYTIQEDVENANIEIGPIKTTTESVDTHFTFGEAGLTIGRDNLKNKLNLTNERISFISDGSHDSTYITENTFYSHNIVVRDALTMINHTITNYQDKTVFRYVGK